MNKQKKKLLLGLGAIAIPIIPIATSISMSTNTTQSKALQNRAATPTVATIPAQGTVISPTDWNAFKTRVNDDTVGVVDTALMTRFTQSQVYKQTSEWNNMTHDQIFAAISSILKAPDETKGGFTLDEKVNLAKYVIQENSYASIMKAAGFNETSVAQKEVIATVGNLKNPIVTTSTRPTTLLNDGKTIVSKGKTGLNKDFATNNSTNSVLYNISNQTIANYFVGSVILSKAFDDARVDLNGAIKAGDPFIDILNGFSTNITQILVQYETSNFSVADMLKLSPFEFMNIPSGINPATNTAYLEDEYYEIVMNSSVGTHLFGASAQEKIDNYKSETDDAEKIAMRAEILTGIARAMRGEENHDPIEDLNNVVDFTSSPNVMKGEYIESVKKFATLATRYSDKLSSDISLKISGDFVNGHSAWVKTGHDPVGTWTKVGVDELSTWKVSIDDSIYEENYLLSGINQIGKEVDEKTTTALLDQTIHVNLPNITENITSKAIWSEINTNMTLTPERISYVNMNTGGHTYLIGQINTDSSYTWVAETDSNHKHLSNTEPLKMTMNWAWNSSTDYIASNKEVGIWWQLGTNKLWGFDLIKEIRKQVTEKLAELQKNIDDSLAGSGSLALDSTAQHKVSVVVKDITVNSWSMDIANDGTVSNFHLDNVTADLETKITETKVWA